MNTATTTDAAPPSYTTLISAEELRAILDAGAAPAIIDTRFDLTDVAAGEAAWHAGHLPGSIYLHLDRDLCGPKTDAAGAFRGRHPLPARADFAATLGRSGITANCISPGTYFTDQARHAMEAYSAEQMEAAIGMFSSMTAVGRWGNPQDLVAPLPLPSEDVIVTVGAVV